MLPSKGPSLVKIVLYSLLLALIACSPASSSIEISDTPYLFSIKDGSLSLAPNTNPLIYLHIKGHPVYTIEMFSLNIEIFNEGLQLWPVGHSQPEHIYTYPDILLPKQELKFYIQCWEYYGFDRVEIRIRDVLFSQRKFPISCDSQDCQEMTLYLRGRAYARQN